MPPLACPETARHLPPDLKPTHPTNNKAAHRLLCIKIEDLAQSKDSEGIHHGLN